MISKREQSKGKKVFVSEYTKKLTRDEGNYKSPTRKLFETIDTKRVFSDFNNQVIYNNLSFIFFNYLAFVPEEFLYFPNVTRTFEKF